LCSDVIAVIDKGKLIEMGNHNELLAMGGTYANLVRFQVWAHSEQKAAESAKNMEEEVLLPLFVVYCIVSSIFVAFCTYKPCRR
jgi:hypothetical protein